MVSASGMYERMAGVNRFGMAEVSLMISLMVIAFVPSINDIVVSRLAYGGGIINIIGQIEWFDTINETALAFLIFPMYNLLNSVKSNRGDLKNRISQMTVLGFTIYLIFTVVVFVLASSLADTMGASPESVGYLRLMTVGFVFDYLAQITMVVLVILGKSRNVNILILVKVAILAVSDVILMNQFSYMGAAAAYVVCNVAMVFICAYVLKKENILSLKPKFEKVTLMQWVKVGKFSGGEIFLNNLVYVLMVCMMVNAVGESGNYWVANSFIWGWLLVPIFALTEIVKRDYVKGNERLQAYGFMLVLIFLVWMVTLPSWEFIYGSVFGVTDPGSVASITYMLVPFYLAYGVSAIFDAIFLSVGRTGNTFFIAIVVNIVYYGILYLVFEAGLIEPSMTFIVLMFGFGMVIHSILSVFLFIRYRRKNIEPVGITIYDSLK